MAFTEAAVASSKNNSAWHCALAACSHSGIIAETANAAVIVRKASFRFDRRFCLLLPNRKRLWMSVSNDESQNLMRIVVQLQDHYLLPVDSTSLTKQNKILKSMQLSNLILTVISIKKSCICIRYTCKCLPRRCQANTHLFSRRKLGPPHLTFDVVARFGSFHHWRMKSPDKIAAKFFRFRQGCATKH